MITADFTFSLTTVIFFTNIILAFILVFLERKNPSTTWAWLLVLFFIPVLGFILYLFLGQNLRKAKVFTAKNDTDLIKMKEQYEKLLERRHDPISTTAIEDNDLINLELNSASAIYTDNNRVQILNNGDEKFPLLIEELKNAKKHIHMEYYIIRNDDIGRKIRDILAEKAREGVEVRLLYDGMGCIRLSKSFFKPITDAGGETVEFYPPFLPYINVRVNYRNHRKIVIIDGKKAFIGGLNLGDEYMGKSTKYGFWRDLHFLIEGNAVDFLQLRFMTDWQFASKMQLKFLPQYFPQKKAEGSTGVQIVSSGPDSKWQSIRQGFFKMITKAEKSIYIQTPYFVPEDSLKEALKIAALGGVDVKIMIPEKRDHPFVHWASTSYLSELLDAGVKAYIYEKEKGFLHSKLVVVDDRIVSVGSSNFDIRSFSLNFEVNAFIYDPVIARQLTALFTQDLQDCWELTIEGYNKRSHIIRIKEAIARLLSPLL